MRYKLRACVALACALTLTGQSGRGREAPRDPANPTCPQNPNWTDIPQMTLTPVTRNGVRILMAEGVIDAGLPERLEAALNSDQTISEIWLRSSGGNARAGNAAGLLIRRLGVQTKIPSGWTCFSACNFMFMGGVIRTIEPGGVFMAHMFTFTSDRGAIRYSVDQGAEATTELIGDVEQESALLASEDNDFLIRMGISRRLLTEVMYRQRAVATESTPPQRYCLTLEEAQRYNVHSRAQPQG